jgi:hypothetical protein
MASLIDKRVNDVGAGGQNTSPDSNKNPFDQQKSHPRSVIFEVALRWKPECVLLR